MCVGTRDIPKPLCPRHLSTSFHLAYSSLLAIHPAQSLLTPYPVAPRIPLPVWLELEAVLSIAHNGLTPLSAPSSGQSQHQTMVRPLLSELSVSSHLPYLERGECHSVSLPLECQAAFWSPGASSLPHPHPHPQPHPASLVLSHHGNRISKWEGLESPHILPPPLVSHCAPPSVAPGSTHVEEEGLQMWEEVRKGQSSPWVPAQLP
jgi:hypothetical protein